MDDLMLHEEALQTQGESRLKDLKRMHEIIVKESFDVGWKNSSDSVAISIE